MSISNEKFLPPFVRVSTGSAAVINLIKCKVMISPSTVHLMTYHPNRCSENCSFCPQAKDSTSKSIFLSRVSWPKFSTQKVLTHIKKSHQKKIVNRVCIQAINYSEVFADLISLIRLIRMRSCIPISVSCQTENKLTMHQLKNAGVDRIGIPIDVATETLFDDIKGKNVDSSYRWENQFFKLKTAIEVFGIGNVSTHLIVGLGESEKDILLLIRTLSDLDVIIALFAFTPIRGTKLELRSQPPIESYRRIQLAKYLIEKNFIDFDRINFNDDGEISNFGIKKSRLIEIVKSGTPFLTSGCPSCNRPFYNEKPTGSLYNYPRNLKLVEINEILKIFNL
jgi:biotin synthase